MFIAVTEMAMAVLGAALLAWPSKVQELAIRVSESSLPSSVTTPFVRSDAYIGMVRAIGAFLLLLAAIVGLALLNGVE